MSLLILFLNQIGHHAEMKKIQDAYEKGELCELKEVHDAAGVLKKVILNIFSSQ